MIKVAIILVAWNNWKDTEDCLLSLQKLDTKGLDIEVIVVDNGSSTHPISRISKKFPKVHIIEHPTNIGFSGGNNIGIKYALSKGALYIWLLNNDTFVDPQACLTLVDSLVENRGGVVGSKIYFSPGYEYHRSRYKESERGKVLWYAGGVIDWENMYASHRGVDEIDTGQFKHAEDTAYVTGCSMMFSADVVKKAGMLDESYFLYYEDVEFCLRSKAMGFTILFEPKSRIWHKNSGSSDGPGGIVQEYYQTRNRYRVGMKYCFMRTKFALLRECMKFLFLGRPVQKKAAFDFLFHRFGKQI
ncbi:MAG: glycosyltransferase family 2 protein [Patescibacteria group bacterium]